MRLRIAARRSALARLQAFQAGAALARKYPQLELNYHFRASLGDLNAAQPLWQMPEKGVFTQDFHHALRAGECDLVVHSWKDLPVEATPGTVVAATLPRADARDVLLLRADRRDAVAATGRLNVLTSSPRRAYNLASLLPAALPFNVAKVEFTPVRGNVQTRLAKLLQTPGADALVVAKAALDRLLAAAEEEFAPARAEVREALTRVVWMVLPLQSNPPAAAQGALALEAREDDGPTLALLREINDAQTFAAAQRERAILRSYGGGCHQKIGVAVLSRPFGEITFLRGMTDEGRVLDETRLEAARSRPPRVARERLWPLARTEGKWYERNSLAVNKPDAGGAAWWIAKSEAWPADWQSAPADVVWASGWQTWQKLARRGVWVNGCAESLGEAEDPQVDMLLGHAPDWVKLTHDASRAETTARTLPTYHLELRPDALNGADFVGPEYFYWSSGTQFRDALRHAPQLREKTHFCGPGHTYAALTAEGLEPHVFLSPQQWQEEMSA